MNLLLISSISLTLSKIEHLAQACQSIPPRYLMDYKCMSAAMWLRTGREWHSFPRGPACHEVSPLSGRTRQCTIPSHRNMVNVIRLVHTAVSNTPQGMGRPISKDSSLQLFTCLEHAADDCLSALGLLCSPHDGSPIPLQLCRMSTGCSDHQQMSKRILAL